jgi:Rrf2 family protein
MKISKRTQYGLRAMVCLAQAFQNKEKICSLKEISEKENISFDYLEKIVSQLEKKGFIESKRGAKGGYFLKQPPKKIKVGEIVKTLEGTMAPVRCVAVEKKERYNCPRKRSCKTLNVWRKIQNVLDSTLNSITLADLIK